MLRHDLPRPSGGDDYFIGQLASATAAWVGKIVTNLPPTYCSSTGSASLFWPVSSNLMRFQGMMVFSPGISVAVIPWGQDVGYSTTTDAAGDYAVATAAFHLLGGSFVVSSAGQWHA